MPETQPPLHQSVVKLRRAHGHLVELEAAFAKYLIATPPQASAKIVATSEGGWGVSFEFSSVALPDEAGAIFGDAVHNMRTALDLAACECVRSNGKSDKGVYFPFCEKSDDLDKAIKDRHLTRADPEVVQFIRSLKPYQDGNAALRGLHDLGSGLIDHNQKMSVAAMQMADMKACAQRS